MQSARTLSFIGMHAKRKPPENDRTTDAARLRAQDCRFRRHLLSSPDANWDKSARPPGWLGDHAQGGRRADRSLLLRGGRALGIPWDGGGSCARFAIRRRLQGTRIRSLAQLANGPNVDLYPIDVSFAALRDKAEFEYLNNLSTSFVLPSEAVDRLRSAAGTIILASPEFKRMMKDAVFDMVTVPP
jgi:NTE family protein